ncbi:hypothetical protein [Bacillus cereus]|uniref:hypothetical protein n=1 Tax=Bacillus cereus TaxID=1396 RepID=UPI002D766885|nr:hypothetical protein [Bacillus cereus]
MSIKDVTELFSNYANQWNQQNGGGSYQFSLLQPGYESYAVKSSNDQTTYYPARGIQQKEIELATLTYTNTSSEPKEVNIELAGEIENSGEWILPEGAFLSGKTPINVDVYGHDTVAIDQTPISIYVGDTEKLTRLQRIVTHRKYTILPRTKVTATLRAKQKYFTQPFDVKTDLSGYLTIIQKLANGNSDTSMHHVAAILQRYYSPYIQVNDTDVTLSSKGTFTGITFVDAYIHIETENLDVPGVVESYNLYDIYGQDVQLAL